jgi:hypothetical protein
MFNILEPGARNRYGFVVRREPVLFLGAAGESVWLDGLIWGTRCYASRDVVVIQRRLGGLKLKLKKKWQLDGGGNLWESEECGVGWIDVCVVISLWWERVGLQSKFCKAMKEEDGVAPWGLIQNRKAVVLRERMMKWSGCCRYEVLAADCGPGQRRRTWLMEERVFLLVTWTGSCLCRTL